MASKPALPAMHVWTFLSQKYKAMQNSQTNYGLEEAGMVGGAASSTTPTNKARDVMLRAIKFRLFAFNSLSN